MPYCFPRSSIKFQDHTGQNITDFDPNWAFPDYRPVAAFKSLRFALLDVAKFFFLVKIAFQSSTSAPHICETVLQVLMAGRVPAAPGVDSISGHPRTSIGNSNVEMR